MLLDFLYLSVNDKFKNRLSHGKIKVSFYSTTTARFFDRSSLIQQLSLMFAVQSHCLCLNTSTQGNSFSRQTIHGILKQLSTERQPPPPPPPQPPSTSFQHHHFQSMTGILTGSKTVNSWTRCPNFLALILCLSNSALLHTDT